MTLALARKWRPRSFAEMVGQEHVVRALRNALEQNRLHHAYLMTGTRGVGKTTLARVMAKALNCETGVTASPCGECSTCREIDGGRFVDLIELDAASNTQVDQMRDLLENALYAPTRARFKVYIIDEVHMLSRSAFNAMLKTLEEPPEHVKFILATTDPQKVPVTVLSRCLQFNLKQIPLAQIRDQLATVLGREQIEFEHGALPLIARAAQGSMRDGLSLLDQAIAHGGGRVLETAVREMLGTVGEEFLFQLLEALSQASGPELLAAADGMQECGVSFESALQDLAALLHRLALFQAVPEAIDSDAPERSRLEALAGTFAAEDLQLYYQIAVQGRSELPLAPDEYAGFTMTLLRMLAFMPEPAAGDAPQASAPARPAGQAVRGPAVAGAGTAPQRPGSETVTAAPAPDARLDPARWADLVVSLKLGGMARMLAQHTELIGVRGARVDLRVAVAHKHLLDKPYRDKLQSVLGEHLGRPVQIEFHLGDPAGATPAQVEDRERQARQRSAIEAIDRDPFVRELVESFDARVADESIRPAGDAQARRPADA
ncbi:MAG: DNA polymerase III subunit gamma/tau [Burkholderiales bacterium]|nr:DNA polymerase III subunit gamma/tau [Burkholderiales bacterium]